MLVPVQQFLNLDNVQVHAKIFEQEILQLPGLCVKHQSEKQYVGVFQEEDGLPRAHS